MILKNMPHDESSRFAPLIGSFFYLKKTRIDLIDEYFAQGLDTTKVSSITQLSHSMSSQRSPR